MNVDGPAEVIEDLVEGAKLGVVSPAVNVDGFDIEDLFTEAFGGELRDARLPRPAGSGDDGSVGRFPVRYWFENTGEVVDFGISMLNFSRDESGAENASIAHHSCLIDWFSG